MLHQKYVKAEFVFFAYLKDFVVSLNYIAAIAHVEMKKETRPRKIRNANC
jgi:hypothetical protein